MKKQFEVASKSWPLVWSSDQHLASSLTVYSKPSRVFKSSEGNWWLKLNAADPVSSPHCVEKLYLSHLAPHGSVEWLEQLTSTSLTGIMKNIFAARSQTDVDQSARKMYARSIKPPFNPAEADPASTSLVQQRRAP